MLDPNPRINRRLAVMLAQIDLLTDLLGGTPPSYRELADACGVASTNTVAVYVGRLERLGLVAKTPGKSRTLRLTAQGAAWR